MKKIYLIGKVPNVIDKSCETKFCRTQIQLTKVGFNVINPVERLSNPDVSVKEATRRNFHDLMLCDAVYIMPCFSLAYAKNNFELKWAIKFNLTIINGFTDVSSDNVEIVKEKKIQKKKKNSKII